MLQRNRSRRARRGSMLVLLTLMTPFVLLPLAGLAVDATMCFIVQAKLQAAVDGAALGAGRLLGTNADPREIAGEFMDVNFAQGYWGASNLVKNIQVTNALGSSTISI